MVRQAFLLGLSLLFMGVVIGAFPASSEAQQRLEENFIFVNYIGQEVILDLDDMTYVVPGINVAPEGGRLALNLPSGEHKFAAHVPGVALGSAGEFRLNAGEVVAKAAHIQQTEPAIDRNGIVLAEPRDQVVVFDFDPFAVPADSAPAVDTWQPAPAAPGQGSLVWVNYWGRDELHIDMNGTIYKVPPATNDIPGRLQLDLDPGLYRFTVSVPYGGLNNEVNVPAGQITALNIWAEPQPEPEFEIGEKSPLPQPVTLRLSQENFTPAVATADEVPAVSNEAPITLPNTGATLPAESFEEVPPTPGLGKSSRLPFSLLRAQ